MGNDPHEDHAQRESLGYTNADEVAHCESGGIGDITDRIREILHNLAYCQEPDEDLDEPEERGEVLEASGYKYDPHRSQTDVQDACRKDQKRQQHPGIIP